MRLKLTAALCFGLVILGLAAAPADAQTKRRVVVSDGAGTRYVETDESGRTRTKVVVQRRSFLDGGTEVLPGQRKFTDYVFPPGYSPTSVIDNTNGGGIRFPLPGYFDLLGRDNPYPYP
jgi:hypothetical protein